MPIRKDTEPRLLRYIYTGRRETQLGIEFHMRSGAAFQREGAGSFGRRLRHSGITVFVPQNGENGSGQCFRITRRHEQAIDVRSEEHTSELQSLMRISYAVFCLKKKTQK